MVKLWYVDAKHRIGIDWSTGRLIAFGPNALDYAIREADSRGFTLIPPKGSNVAESLDKGWPVICLREGMRE